MGNKLSYSQISMYQTCGQKYAYHYRKGYREKYMHSALLFGSAMDEGLNELLLTRDLNKALVAFDKKWNFQFVNKKMTALKEAETIVYAEKDFDADLLQEECDLVEYNRIKESKSLIGFDNLTVEERKYYNKLNWLCLKTKGEVMIRSYNQKVMPDIEEVIKVQHQFSLSNGNDEVVAVADMIVKMKDGRILLLDNKTSSREYDSDQAQRSQQLLIYYHRLKDEFNLSPFVGFIVMNKNIRKNKVKICSVCGFDGSGGRHKTCSQGEGKNRCNGEWTETVDPECWIQIVINPVMETAEDLVLEAFDDAATGIQNQYWYKNLQACKNGPIVCPYFQLCWFKKEDDIIKTKDEK